MSNDTVLVLVVIVALCFDFTNGFHDTGNAMATSIATGALGPRVAVAISGGLGKKGAEVRWNVAGRMATAWVFTLPSAAIVGATAYGLAYGVGGTWGVVVDLIVLAALSGFIYWRSRGSKVDPSNVNAEWTGGVAPEKVPAETAAA